MAKLYKYLSRQGGSTAPDATQENEHSPSSVSPFSSPATKCGRCKCGRSKSTIQGNKRFKAKDLSSDPLPPSGKSIAFISDEGSHDSFSMHATLNKLLPEVHAFVPDLEHVFNWTDSPTSQFRTVPGNNGPSCIQIAQLVYLCHLMIMKLSG